MSHEPQSLHSKHKAHHHEVHRPTAVFVLCVIALIGLLAGIAIVTTTSSVKADPKPYSKTPIVGQTIVTNLYEVSVTKVELLSGQDPAFTPPADKQVLALTLVIKNNSTVPLSFSPSTTTFLRDEAGDQFVMAPSMLLTQPIVGGEIPGGQSRGGQLSYWVPKNLETAKHLKFYFDPRWGDMQPVSFDLGL